ncbi:hypothetical protein KA005_56410 [bacterium]|nr:hypothetical protein [bacterium]
MSQTAKRILSETSFPALFGVILVVIGWTIMQLDTFVCKLPLIETSLTCTSIGNRTFVHVKLFNINPDKLIKELEVILTITDPHPQIKYLKNSHALHVPSPSRLQTSPTLSDKDFKFTITEFQPYNEILATALIVGTAKPNLVIKSPEQPVQTMEKNVVTILAKNRLKTLLILLLLYLVLASTYIYRLSKKYKTPI